MHAEMGGFLQFTTGIVESKTKHLEVKAFLFFEKSVQRKEILGAPSLAKCWVTADFSVLIMKTVGFLLYASTTQDPFLWNNACSQQIRRDGEYSGEGEKTSW